jgi:hypothetical protein
MARSRIVEVNVDPETRSTIPWHRRHRALLEQRLHGGRD